MSEYIKKEDILFKKWQFKFKDINEEYWFVNVKDIEGLPVYSFPEREDVFDRMKNEFISKYPKNYAGELEFGGRFCHFSLNEITSKIQISNNSY